MQLTDWLVVIFVVAIVVVLVDGVRRKFAERRSRVVMKLERNIPQDVDPEEFPLSELPNGGARTLDRGDEPPPNLRTLQARRKRSFRSMRPAEGSPAEGMAGDTGVRAVPVLLDTVDIEEERIEHTNVFGDPRAVAPFEADDFASDAHGRDAAALSDEPAPAEDDELIDGLDEEYEEDAMLAPEIARKEPGYMDTRYMGRRDDDDEDEFEDEEEYEDDEEEDEEDDEEEFEEFDEDLDEDEEDDDYDEEDDDEEDDDDDYDDEDEDDYEDEDDEEEDEEDDEDIDELEGLPEDDWGTEEEESRLVDDYENEPMPLQGAFDKAASTLDKVASQAANQLDKVATQAASQLDRVASTAATQFDKVTSQAATQLDKVATHAASQFDRAATQAAGHLKRPPREAEQRIEPGFGGDASAEQFDEPTFSEDFSANWTDEEFDVADAAADAIVPREVERPQPVPTRREQGELFGEAPRASTQRDVRQQRERDAREGSGLMAALQKAVPARAQQPAPEPVPAAPTPQEVIVINVMARAGQLLHGGDLLRVLQGQGMRLGDMSIFHRHADSSGTGPVMFSMANMVKPGTFELAGMEDFATPGVSFFLQMPNRLGNMACFDKMLATASAVRDTFDAELKDEQRSVFTRQTVEHCRQRVRDFELKLLSRK